MRHASALSLAFGVFVSTVAVPIVALADPVTITGGSVSVFSPMSGVDWAGFQLTSSDSSFTGVVVGSSTGLILTSGAGNLSGTANLTSSIPFPLATQQIVGGTAYRSFVTGELTFSTPTFIVPPPSMAGTSFEFSAPFTASGNIVGRAANDITTPVQFSVDLAGSGIATVRGEIVNPGDPFYIARSVQYAFQPAAAAAAPTPEPASVLLLLAGGLVGLRVRMNGVMRTR